MGLRGFSAPPELKLFSQAACFNCCTRFNPEPVSTISLREIHRCLVLDPRSALRLPGNGPCSGFRAILICLCLEFFHTADLGRFCFLSAICKGV